MNPESNASTDYEGGPSGESATKPASSSASLSVIVNRDGVQWRVHSPEWVRKLEPVLVQPDRLLESVPDRIYSKPGVDLVRIPTTVSGSARWVLRRNTYVRPVARLRDSFRSPAAVRAFRNSLAFRRAGIPTPRVLAAGIRRRFWVPVAGYLLMDEIFPVSTLVQFLRKKGSLPTGVLRRVAAAIARMHAHGILHGDLTINNILLDAKQEPWFVDLDRVRFSGAPLNIAAAAEDFYRLVRHVDSTGHGARTSALRLSKYYCATRDWQGRERELIKNTLRRLREKVGSPEGT